MKKLRVSVDIPQLYLLLTCFLYFLDASKSFMRSWDSISASSA